MSTELTDPALFSRTIQGLKDWFGPDLQTVVFNSEDEGAITKAFFAGKLNDVVKFNTDSSGKIRMYLHGVKAMFTDKVPFGRWLVVLNGHKPRPTSGPNPVFPKTGPGGPNNGGTPIAKAA